MRNTSPVLKANVEILRQASKIYSPKVFKMFEDEYVKAWDCTIEKISKAGTKVEYKVIYAGRGTKHHVRFEPSPTIVESSCMKFSFVGILCAHALKVLDKKNIKKIIEQYISNRWTKDARDGDVSSSTQALGSFEKSIGKRCFNLNYNFREISTLAVEADSMYEYAYEVSVKLMKDLQEMRKKLPSQTLPDQSELSDEVCNSNHEQVDFAIAGVKTKATVGRPKGRIKGALEKRKGHKVQHKSKASELFIL
ncbi:Protein FAR1-RELATED SEQUENCE 9 [Linum perenne]